jgi:hypothetical protein
VPNHNQVREMSQNEKDGMQLLRRTSISGRKDAIAVDLLDALQDLYETSGEANIPLINSKAVRKMGKFMAARDKAKAAVERAVTDYAVSPEWAENVDWLRKNKHKLKPDSTR